MKIQFDKYLKKIQELQGLIPDENLNLEHKMLKDNYDLLSQKNE